mgnify:CR=1 FL=1
MCLRRLASQNAAPSMYDMCRSWPQPCITPSLTDENGRPVSSVDGQTIDVGAQCDAWSRLVAADQSDHAGFERIVEHFDVVCAQQLLNVGAGLVFLEAAFGVRMQIVPDFDDLRRDFDMFAHG